MSSIQDSSIPENAVETTRNDKEYNFSQIRRQLETERQGRLEAEKAAKEYERQLSSRSMDDDSSDEPYIDEKRLNKKLASFEKTMDQRIEERAEQKARLIIEEEKKHTYLRENHDFNSTMSSENVERLAQKHPRLAENILKMPDGFERQKLVYENIKALGLDRPEQKQPSVQEKIDANRRSPYYQPSGVGTSPYSNVGDFSPAGQKNAYEKMKQLIKNKY